MPRLTHRPVTGRSEWMVSIGHAPATNQNDEGSSDSWAQEAQRSIFEVEMDLSM